MIKVRGVYELDGRATHHLIEGRDNDIGENYYEVPLRLVSNPIDGLPEKLELRFRSDFAKARLLADRPNLPIQITVQVDLR